MFLLKDELLIQLVKSKCLPSLLYAMEALLLARRTIIRWNSPLTEFCSQFLEQVPSILYMIYVSISICHLLLNLIIRRKFCFLSKMLNSSNMLCASCKDTVMLDFKLNL